jgi:meiotically up-regulated gene 157 (Mug157) protein
VLVLTNSDQDDANIPSLLSAPLSGYLDRDDPIYQNTRRFVLSKENPYFAYGSVINSYG